MSDRSAHVTIEFRHPGFHDDPPGADELYAAVGRFVRSWSEFEAVLDGLLGVVAAMPERAEQRRVRRDLVPAPLSKKAEMWRAAFDGIPALGTRPKAGAPTERRRLGDARRPGAPAAWPVAAVRLGRPAHGRGRATAAARRE